MHPRRHLAAARLRRRAYAGGREAGVASIQIVVLMPVRCSCSCSSACRPRSSTTGAISHRGRPRRGPRAAAAQNGTAIAGQSAATAFVAAAGGEGTLQGVTVTSNRTATTATVSVTATTLSVIPGWTLSITQSASAPVERLTR